MTARTNELPPHDDATEAGALACVLGGEPDEAVAFFDQLVLADFYDHKHRTIHGALAELRESQKPLDVPSVYTHLRDKGQLEEAGGFDYVQRLPDATPSPANFPRWLATLQDYRQRREDLAESVRLRFRAVDGTATKTASDDDEAELARLATLPMIEYERARKAAAKRFGCRPAVLDAEVGKRRPRPDGDAQEQAQSILPQAEPQPWPQTVDGIALLDSLVQALNRYVVFAPHSADALALFILETYAAEHFDAAPYIHLTSPAKRCGKSLVMRLLARLCARALPAGSCSESSIFRAIAAITPTLLIDEVDTFFAERDELRGILNVGNVRDDACVLRSEEVRGQDGKRTFVVRRYPVFCPKVFAGIGRLADTLADRCISLRQDRKRPDEKRVRFRRRDFDAEPFRQQCRRWAEDHAEALAASRPTLPDELNDRAADLWEPLLAIADIVGRHWPERARAAAIALSGETENCGTGGLGELLLADIAELFGSSGADKLSSIHIVEHLKTIEGREWSEWGKARKPISTNQLAKQLRPFRVFSRAIRIGDETPRGYELADFRKAFDRYLPKSPVPGCNSATTLANIDDSRISEV